MKEQWEKIFSAANEDIKNAKTTDNIEEIKLKYLSRKGELNSIKKNLKDLSDEDKKIIGALANNVSNELENLLETKNNELYKIELDKELSSEKIDITLP